MNEFKQSDELCELSKNDRAIIVGSEIRGAIQELRNGIERRDKLIEQMREALLSLIEYDVLPSEYTRRIQRAKDALEAAERGGR